MAERHRRDSGTQPRSTGHPFEVIGGFLSRGGYPMRNWLDVVRRSTPQPAPEIMIIMMNPGSSGPREAAEGDAQPQRLARPDRTQLQITRLMDAIGLSHARIINLSDFRTSRSQDLVRFLASGEAATIDHSIFSPTRREELESLLVRDIPIVYAWGVHTSILPLAKRAIEVVGISSALGVPKAGTPHAFYHPLPPVHSKQIAWVREVAAQFHARNTRGNSAPPLGRSTRRGLPVTGAGKPG